MTLTLARVTMNLKNTVCFKGNCVEQKLRLNASEIKCISQHFEQNFYSTSCDHIKPNKCLEFNIVVSNIH